MNVETEDARREASQILTTLTPQRAAEPPNQPTSRPTMLRYALIFFVVALIAALFGFGGIAAGATEIAKVLFFIFVVLFVISLVAGLVRRGP